MKIRTGLACLAFVLLSGTALAQESHGSDTEAGHASATAEVAEPAEDSSEPPLQEHAVEAGGEAAGDAAGPWVTKRTPMPFDVIRSIQFLQDQIARGNEKAIRVQALLLRRFAPVFLEAEPSVWQDPRNFRAAILFTLSGGPPEMLERLAATSMKPDATQSALIKGALAYVRNDLASAQSELKTIDLATLDMDLGAQLALVLGQINQADDRTKAVEYLDLARLLAPGTLIEEAALRLEVVLVDALGDHEKADRLARRYLDRYVDSTYAVNFEARLISVYASRKKPDAKTVMATIADTIARVPSERQERLYLGIGRRALVEGNLPLADVSSTAALGLMKADDPDRTRGELYAAASQVSSGDPSDTLRKLDAIDREALHPEDVDLLEAALSVLGDIQETPRVLATNEQTDSKLDLPLVDRAMQALKSGSQTIDTLQP